MKDVSKNRKIIYIEFLRLIAIIFVIFNHTNTNGYSMFITRTPSNIMFWIYLFISIFCKFAVPIFFMISGVLLFKKKYTIKAYLKKISRFLLILIVFSLIYYLLGIRFTGNSFDLMIFLKKLSTCGICIPLWYLYMYILFLVSCPFIYMIVKNIKMEHFNYLIALIILLEGIIPCIFYVLFKEPIYYYQQITPLWLINVIVIYPCLGYFIENKLKFNDKKYLKYMWILNILLIIITELMVYCIYRVNGQLTENNLELFHNCFVPINAITIFITIKYLVENHKLNNFLLKIAGLGKYVFGIYLLHMIITRFHFYQNSINYINTLHLPGFVITLYMCTTLFISGLIMTIILSKIPKVKKLVGF